MSNIVVWSIGCFLEIELAKSLGVDLFNGAEYHQSLQIEDWFKIDPRFKIVVVSLMTFENAIYNNGNLKRDLSWADLVICYNHELISVDQQTLERHIEDTFNTTKFIMMSSGKINYMNFDPKKFLIDYFHWPLKVVSSNHFVDTNNIDTKPKMFDALLGGNNNKRILLFDLLEENNLKDCSLINLNTNPWIVEVNKTYRSPDLDQYEDTEILKFRNKGTTPMELYSANPLEISCHNVDFPISMSSRISWEIYRNTWYSIVSETATEYYTYFTEKTFKPIFAKRLFVLFAEPLYLKKLQALGYKTFSCVIDESYDSEKDQEKRYRMACNQLVRLSQLNPVEVYKQIQSIIDHNHNLVIQQRAMLTKLQDFIKPNLPCEPARQEQS